MIRRCRLSSCRQRSPATIWRAGWLRWIPRTPATPPDRWAMASRYNAPHPAPLLAGGVMARILVLAALLTMVALAFVPATTAQACSCIRETAAEKYARARVVFVGNISKLEYFYEPPMPG